MKAVSRVTTVRNSDNGDSGMMPNVVLCTVLNRRSAHKATLERI